MTYDENEQIDIIGTKSCEDQTIIKEKPRSSGSAERIEKLWEKKARIYRKDLVEIGYDYSTTELRRRMKKGTLPEWEPITSGARKKGWKPEVMLEALIKCNFLD